MSVQFKCCFGPHLPTNMFETLIVELQRTAIERGYTGERYAWKHGLLVKFGTLQTVVVQGKKRVMKYYAVFSVMFVMPQLFGILPTRCSMMSQQN